MVKALRCATSGKVPGSIPGRVTGDQTSPCALGSTQPLKMSTRNILVLIKGGQYVGVTTLPPSCAECQEIWEP